jgi:hypothetical protein
MQRRAVAEPNGSYQHPELEETMLKEPEKIGGA